MLGYEAYPRLIVELRTRAPRQQHMRDEGQPTWAGCGVGCFSDARLPGYPALIVEVMVNLWQRLMFVSIGGRRVYGCIK